MAFRLVTLNLNGIRSAATKGFVDWTTQAKPDCMGVQEIKAQAPDLAGRFEEVAGLSGHFHLAEKKGYSGVGLYCRQTPTAVVSGLGDAAFDAEGRYIECRFDLPALPSVPSAPKPAASTRATAGAKTAKRRPFDKFSLISCYFPSGSSGEERQAAKFRFLDIVYPHLLRLKAEREFILVGDINIAHKEIDLKNWKGNLKNSGFLPEERAWMSRLLDEAGLVDVFRQLNPHPEQYTWWSNRGQARAKNVGWRLDYHLATPAVAALAQREAIYLDQRFSDHAPLTIDYNFTL